MRIFGKVGDLVYSTRNGVNYVKRVSKSARKKASEKQITQREKFGLAARFLSPLRNILNESYRNINSKSYGLNAAIKQMLAEAITGEYPDLKINYSKVSLIRGPVGRPIVEINYVPGSSEIQLFWTPVMNSNSYLDDELLAFIFCPQLSEKWLQIDTGICRYEQTAVIKLPAQLAGKGIHIWLAYRSVMMEAFSDSVYMGQLFTQKPQSNGNS